MSKVSFDFLINKDKRNLKNVILFQVLSCFLASIGLLFSISWLVVCSFMLLWFGFVLLIPFSLFTKFTMGFVSSIIFFVFMVFLLSPFLEKVKSENELLKNIPIRKNADRTNDGEVRKVIPITHKPKDLVQSYISKEIIEDAKRWKLKSDKCSNISDVDRIWKLVRFAKSTDPNFYFIRTVVYQLEKCRMQIFEKIKYSLEIFDQSRRVAFQKMYYDIIMKDFGMQMKISKKNNKKLVFISRALSLKEMERKIASLHSLKKMIEQMKNIGFIQFEIRSRRKIWKTTLTTKKDENIALKKEVGILLNQDNRLHLLNPFIFNGERVFVIPSLSISFHGIHLDMTEKELLSKKYTDWYKYVREAKLERNQIGCQRTFFFDAKKEYLSVYTKDEKVFMIVSRPKLFRFQWMEKNLKELKSLYGRWSKSFAFLEGKEKSKVYEYVDDLYKLQVYYLPYKKRSRLYSEVKKIIVNVKNYEAYKKCLLSKKK